MLALPKIRYVEIWVIHLWWFIRRIGCPEKPMAKKGLNPIHLWMNMSFSKVLCCALKEANAQGSLQPCGLSLPFGVRSRAGGILATTLQSSTC